MSGDPATYLDQFVPDSVDKEAEVALTTATTWTQDTSRDKGETKSCQQDLLAVLCTAVL